MGEGSRQAQWKEEEQVGVGALGRVPRGLGKWDRLVWGRRQGVVVETARKGRCGGAGWGGAGLHQQVPPPDGYYLHMLSNTFPRAGVARLRSPPIWEQGPLCIHFVYRLFGLSWGAQLRLLLLHAGQHRGPNTLWKHLNSQSPSWTPTTVTVPADELSLPKQVRPTTGGRGGAAVGSRLGCLETGLGPEVLRGAWGGSLPPPQLVFEGMRGNTAYLDIALDDISLHRGSCNQGEF